MRAYIYEVTNKSNGKNYIGLTQFSVKRRWAQHVQNARRGLKTYFYNAIAKYGIENFHVETIATCIDANDAWLVEREVIRDRKPAYNMTNGGEFTVGKRVAREVVERIRIGNLGKKRTAECRALQSSLKKAQIASDPEYRRAVMAAIAKAAQNVDRGKQRAAASASNRARQWTASSRAKLSASCIGRRYGRDVIAKMAASKCKKVECTTLGTVFDSISEAAELLGLDITGISRVCRQLCPHAGGLRFQFIQGNK